MAGTRQPGSYHIIPVSKIASFQLLSLAPSNNSTNFTTASPPLHPIDLRALHNRAQNAVARLKAADSRRGRGVGKEGQEIFDALSRTLPTRWAEQSIVVLDVVLIKPPYRVEDCAASQAQGAALARVRKVVSGTLQIYITAEVFWLLAIDDSNALALV